MCGLCLEEFTLAKNGQWAVKEQPANANVSTNSDSTNQLSQCGDPKRNVCRFLLFNTLLPLFSRVRVIS